MSKHEWLTVEEVAMALGLSKSRIYQLIQEDELPGAYRVGKRRLKVDRLEFSAWLESRREFGRARLGV